MVFAAQMNLCFALFKDLSSFQRSMVSTWYSEVSLLGRIERFLLCHLFTVKMVSFEEPRKKCSQVEVSKLLGGGGPQIPSTWCSNYRTHAHKYCVTKIKVVKRVVYHKKKIENLTFQAQVLRFDQFFSVLIRPSIKPNHIRVPLPRQCNFTVFFSHARTKFVRIITLS